MGRLTRHVVIPAMMPVLFFSVAFTPVTVLGCRNRGLLALLIALASGFWAVGEAVAAARAGARGGAESKAFRHTESRVSGTEASWRAVGSMILAIPVVALLAMA